jgi:hypothetical protein
LYNITNRDFEAVRKNTRSGLITWQGVRADKEVAYSTNLLLLIVSLFLIVHLPLLITYDAGDGTYSLAFVRQAIPSYIQAEYNWRQPR